MIKLRIVVPAAAAVLVGCGGPTPPAQTMPTPPTTSISTPVGNTGILVVDQEGIAPDRTQWTVRIETTQGKAVDEIAFRTGRIALTKELAAGEYRLISWHRPCADACPTSGDTGLGPLREVCGAPFAISAGKKMSATVAIDAEGVCTVRVES